MAMDSWSKLSFHHKIFVGLVGYSLLMVACLAAFQYNRERQFKADKLNAQLQLLNDRIIDDISECDTVFEPVLNELGAFDGLRVSIISLDGRLVYDSMLDSMPGADHRGRKEVSDAIREGIGFDTRRHSKSTGQTYFYSAKKGKGYIVRTAMPYSVSLDEFLSADYTFLWVIAGITVAMCFIGFFATRGMGENIARLSEFAERAERGERVYDTAAFPDDELGVISSHIVRLYARLQQALADRDREHRLVMEEEQEKIRIKRRLTNNINHELKTPVAAMQVCLETLMAHPDMAQSKKDEFLGRCYGASCRLNRLLADVSQLTRMEDGGDSIVRENVCVGEIVAEVCDEFKPVAAEKGVEIVCSLGYDAYVKGNATLLASIFRNLIDNALAYSGCSRIDIRQEPADSGYITISVADDGCGVASEHLPLLFERFYRIDKGRSRRAGGTGLGLAIVKNAVLFHGGNITVRNRKPSGLCFTFSLELTID